MLKAHLLSGADAVYRFLMFTGSAVLSIIAFSSKTVFGFIYRLLSKALSFAWKWIFNKIRQPLYEIWCYLITPLAHSLGTLDSIRIQLKKTAELGVGHAFKVCLNAAGKFILWIFSLLKRSFSYVAPAVCIAFLIALIKYAGTLQYTISVEYNGSNLGVINNEADYQQAQAKVQDIITYTEGDTAIIEKPKFTVHMLQSDDTPVDSDSLSGLIINTSEVGIVEAYGFYVNGTLIGVYTEEDMEKIRSALEARFQEHYSADIISVDFKDLVEINQGHFLETNISDSSKAIEYINGSKTVEAYYIVESKDTIASIAKKLGVTAESLKEENPYLTGGFNAGDMITYHYKESNLPVITTRYEQYSEIIERTTQYTYDNNAEVYTEVLVQRGSSGRANITALVTETDGRETDRTISSRQVVVEMVPQIIRTGTKPNETLKGDTSIIDLLGTFVWPVGWDGGYSYVSSLFGYRSWDHSNHKGIDIPAKRGTDIYAASSGTVVFAGTKGAYGKLVIIDHGYGYETYYGHMSSIVAVEGAYVEKGDLIGYVGMTGSASGNHLHIELRHNEKERLDPLLALGGVGSHKVRE